jgi:NAD(P)H dehydrogenase (quinone)
MRGTGVELACPTFFLEWLLFPFVRSTIVEKGIIDLPYGKGRHAPIAAEDQARVIATASAFAPRGSCARK